MGTNVPGSIPNEELNCSQDISSEKCSFVPSKTKMSAWMLSRTHWPRNLMSLLQSSVLRLMTVCSSSVLIVLLLYWFYGGLSLLFLLHIAVLGILYNAQDMLLYFPEQPTSSRVFVESPALYGLAHESIYIRSHDGTQLHTLLVRHSSTHSSTSPTVVFFHGNAGNIGHRLPNVQSMCLHNNINVLLVEYRGFGKSRGSPSEEGLYQDARAALDYIFNRTDINQQKILVFGRSLGGAVALNVASDPCYASRIAAVVVENTFTSIPEMARALFDVSVLHYLPELCYKNKYLSRCLVHKITVPALFICGLQDTLVPPRMMHQLYESCGSRMKRLALFADGTHNDTWQCHGYYEAFDRYMVELDDLHKGKFVAASATYSDSEDASFGHNSGHSAFI